MPKITIHLQPTSDNKFQPRLEQHEIQLTAHQMVDLLVNITVSITEYINEIANEQQNNLQLSKAQDKSNQANENDVNNHSVTDNVGPNYPG